MYTNNRRIGILGYNAYLNRYDVGFTDGTTAGGLHCGEGFEILVNGRWISTRIESDTMYGYWYLVGVADSIPIGAKVRM